MKVKDRINLRASSAFKDGFIEIQDEGSQLVAALVETKANLKTIDLCAGSGGKTLALGAAMKDGGPLIVFEEDGTTCALIPNQAGGYTYYSGAQDSSPENLDKRKSDSFDPIGLVLYRPLPDQPVGLWTLFEFALNGVWRDLHRLLLAGMLLGLIAAVTPVATGLIFDYIIPNAAFSQLSLLIF